MRTLLELGSGGGNNASHLKADFELTLADPSPGMLRVSRALNPECEHVEGDMRTVRLGRTFDGVFVHDAVMYMADLDDLRRALETVAVHLSPGGVAVVVPDCVRETFEPETAHGGHDGDGRALRYLEWTHGAEPDGTRFLTDFVVALREADGSVTVEHDRHVYGLFARDDWLRTFAACGLTAFSVQDEWGRDVFVGRHADEPA